MSVSFTEIERKKQAFNAAYKMVAIILKFKNIFVETRWLGSIVDFNL